MNFRPIHFYNEPIHVIFSTPPILEKKPTCPQSFIWRDEAYHIIEMINEWHDYSRRGKMARNMQPQHAAIASRRGSWGVGVFYFRVKTDRNRFFDIYYDRTPKDVNDRKGNWFLYREVEPIESRKSS